MTIIITLVLSALKKMWPYILCAIAVSFIWFKIHAIDSKLREYETQKHQISILENKVLNQQEEISDIQNAYNDLQLRNNKSEELSQVQTKKFSTIINSNDHNSDDISNSINSIFDGISNQ